jgi:competence protein ComEC
VRAANPAAAPEPRWAWVDLRLVPVAATVWCVSLLTPWMTPLVLGVVAGSALVLAVGAARGRSVRSALVLAVLAGVAVTAGTGVVREAARDGSPLRQAADAERMAVVVMELDGDPHVLSGAGGPRVMLDATVTELVDGALMHRLNSDVLLYAPADQWQGLLPGQGVRVRVSVSPPAPGDDVVAVLSARGPPELTGTPGRLQELAAGVREGLSAAAGRVLEPRTAGLLPGLVVGDTGGMDPVLAEDFRRAGLAHLTAVSGDNATWTDVTS